MEPERNKDCFVCVKHLQFRKNNSCLIFENDLIVVSHALLFGDEKDHYLGHAFVETKRHVPGINDLSKAEAEAVGWFTCLTARALTATMGFEHIYTFVLGDHVPHFHMHVIGRYPETPHEYWGNKVDEWPEAPRGNVTQINLVVEKLHSYFKQQVEGFI